MCGWELLQVYIQRKRRMLEGCLPSIPTDDWEWLAAVKLLRRNQYNVKLKFENSSCMKLIMHIRQELIKMLTQPAITV